jgi:NAD(P)-dependent dehydrogenase (short-subunit alcohol dehydrogenase family)
MAHWSEHFKKWEIGTAMSALAEKTVLITGANAGIGKEIARQLALRPEFGRIYLGCRNAGRANAAKAELQAETGRDIFDIVLMDVADLGSVRAALADIDGPIGALVMNAGVIGPRTFGLTADGVTTVFATNVLGHVVLLEGLLAEGRLGEVAVFVGSEAVRGVPKLRMKAPSLVSTSADELASVIDGSYWDGHKPPSGFCVGNRNGQSHLSASHSHLFARQEGSATQRIRYSEP